MILTLIAERYTYTALPQTDQSLVAVTVSGQAYGNEGDEHESTQVVVLTLDYWADP